MTVDPFNPPELRLTPASFARRRASLLDEIGRNRLGRPLLLAAVVVLAILIPVTAFAVGHDWWFFRSPGEAPAPVTGVLVVKTGVWDGKSWQLTAYRSATDGLCYGVEPTGTKNGEGAVMACGGIAGIPRTPQSNPDSPYAITYAISSRVVLPAFIYGPVTDKAAEVVATFRNGTVVRAPTFPAPKALGAPVRFYAEQLPPSAPLPPPRLGLRPVVEKLVGLDGQGKIVACVTLPFRPEGEPLSACD
jgi:hypothetical protein